MKVGIDVSNLHSLSKKRGIGFYTKYLIDSLKKYTKVEVLVLEGRGDLKQVDLIHYPYFDLYRQTLPFNRSVPTIVTIHDVTPLLFPSHYPPGLRGRLNFLKQRLSLINVKAVITDSYASKKDIEKKLGVNLSKIYPIHLAPADQFRKINDNGRLKALIKKYKLPERFVFYVGSVNWNKNLNNMTEGCLAAGIDVVFAGGDFIGRQNLNHPELKSFKNFLENYSMNEKVHILGFVEDQELVGLINLAQALLLVSFYEGFGLTILEGQACGVPVITSNISSMPEVAGEGALYVDPYDTLQIAEAVKKVAEKSDLREDLIKSGFDNIEKFSWEKTARETVLVYEEVFRGS